LDKELKVEDNPSERRGKTALDARELNTLLLFVTPDQWTNKTCVLEDNVETVRDCKAEDAL